MKTISLDGTWQLTYGPQPGGPETLEEATAAGWPSVEAQVPGNVELDLVRAGVLPELSYADNIYLLREYESYRWWYRRSFTAPETAPGERAELVFEGLDCLGTVWVNGVLVGEPRNMLIPHRFEVTDLLAAGDNELVVRIDSAVIAGRAHQPAAIEGAMAANWESLSIRKAAHMYGWDIMPRLVSAGLWRSVHLDVLPPTRFGDVYLATVSVDRDHNRADLLLDWHVITDEFAIDDWRVEFRLRYEGELVHESTRALVGQHGRDRLTVSEARLWWPRGYGDQPLYEAEVCLLDGAGQVLDTYTQRLGLRTLRLRRTDITTPEHPGEFVFVCNGERIFAKGTNWVPLDALHSRDPQHLAGAFEMVADLNCNMIRCWGGNVYEDHGFFDYCDELGVMVWQDFALACALYPQTDSFCEQIRVEGEEIVRRLRGHASLALWAGNNENDGFYYGGWLAAPIDPNTDRLSRQVLREVVRQFDPFRDYLPSSPYMSPAAIATGNPYAVMPEDHLWGPRDDFKGPYYMGSGAHFVSEIGYHGCPNRESLEQMMDADHLWPWRGNEQWLTHAVRPHHNITSYNYRIQLMANQIAVLFDQEPQTLEDFVLASQISQAEAKKFFIERFRSGKWQRSGILWWNLRDGWPIISDAIVDYYGGRKLAYAYIKRVQTDVCAICGEPAEGRHPLFVVNDTLAPACGQLTVTDLDTGALLFSGDYDVPANECLTVGSLEQAATAAMWVLEFGDGAQRLQNHYLAGPRPFTLEQFAGWLEALGLRG